MSPSYLRTDIYITGPRITWEPRERKVNKNYWRSCDFSKFNPESTRGSIGPESVPFFFSFSWHQNDVKKIVDSAKLILTYQFSFSLIIYIMTRINQIGWSELFHYITAKRLKYLNIWSQPHSSKFEVRVDRELSIYNQFLTCVAAGLYEMKRPSPSIYEYPYRKLFFSPILKPSWNMLK